MGKFFKGHLGNELSYEFELAHGYPPLQTASIATDVGITLTGTQAYHKHQSSSHLSRDLYAWCLIHASKTRSSIWLD